MLRCCDKLLEEAVSKSLANVLAAGLVYLDNIVQFQHGFSSLISAPRRISAVLSANCLRHSSAGALTDLFRHVLRCCDKLLEEAVSKSLASCGQKPLDLPLALFDRILRRGAASPAWGAGG